MRFLPVLLRLWANARRRILPVVMRVCSGIPHLIRRARKVVSYLVQLEVHADREWRIENAALLRRRVDAFEGIEVAETFDPDMQRMVADHQRRSFLPEAEGHPRGTQRDRSDRVGPFRRARR